MPRVFFSGFVMAKRRQTSAAWPQVMNTFWPEIRYASPSRTARVFWLPASDPASGSVSAKQPSFSPRASGVRNLFFWSSLPNFSIGSQTSELLTDRMTPMLAQTREISSITIA